MLFERRKDDRFLETKKGDGDGGSIRKKRESRREENELCA